LPGGPRSAAQRQARILEVLTAALPGLAEDDACVVLTRLRADRGIPLRQLDKHLADHPDALTSGKLIDSGWRASLTNINDEIERQTTFSELSS
jgi:hypothetical protein